MLELGKLHECSYCGRSSKIPPNINQSNWQWVFRERSWRCRDRVHKLVQYYILAYKNNLSKDPFIVYEPWLNNPREACEWIRENLAHPHHKNEHFTLRNLGPEEKRRFGPWTTPNGKFYMGWGLHQRQPRSICMHDTRKDRCRVCSPKIEKERKTKIGDKCARIDCDNRLVANRQGRLASKFCSKSCKLLQPGSVSKQRSSFWKAYNIFSDVAISHRELRDIEGFYIYAEKFVGLVKASCEKAKELVGFRGLPNDCRLIEGKTGKDCTSELQYIQAALSEPESIRYEVFHNKRDFLDKVNGSLFLSVWDWTASLYDDEKSKKLRSDALSRWVVYKQFVDNLGGRRGNEEI